VRFGLLAGGLSGAVVGGVSYFVLSSPSYAGGSGEGIGGIILWLFIAATVACLLAAAYACLPEKPAIKEATQ
jgi:hypothetical protein